MSVALRLLHYYGLPHNQVLYIGFIHLGKLLGHANKLQIGHSKM